MTAPPIDQHSDAPAGASVAPLRAADLQDHLLVAHEDLDRLQRLLSDAGEVLIAQYQRAHGQLCLMLPEDEPDAALRLAPAEPAAAALQHLHGAIMALQFQDMAQQLIGHTQLRLRNCAERLASDTLIDDSEGLHPIRAATDQANPVTQHGMSAGSIELF